MQKGLFTFFLCIVSFVGNAQNLDSLWGIWQDPAKADTIRIAAFKEYVVSGFLYKDPDSAYTLSKEMEDFALKMHNENWVADAKFMQGSTFFMRGELVEALKYFEQTFKIFEQTKSKKGIAKVSNGLAVIHTQLGNHSSAINYYMKALKIREADGDSSSVAQILGNMGLLYKERKEYDKAIAIFNRSMRIAEEANNAGQISVTAENLGIVYNLNGDYDKATDYFKRALKIKENNKDNRKIAGILLNLGGHYVGIGKLDSGKVYLERSLRISEQHDFKMTMLSALANLGEIYQLQNQQQEALKYYKKAHALAMEIGALDKIKSTSSMLARSYKKLGRHKEALEMYELHIATKDSLLSEQNERAIVRQEYKYQYEKEALTDSLEFAKKEAVKDLEIEKQNISISRQRIGLISAGGGLLLILLLAFSIYRGKKRSDELLLNILPEETAKELKKKGHADAKQFDRVTVLFTDFKGFTQISEKLTPSELVAAIDECFKAFDKIIEKYHIEKIKTIGDAYMAAGGLPVPNQTTPQNVVKAALEMRDWMLKYKEKKGENGFEIRIGIHTGPVVAGIVGIKKFQYDIWGDTVNTASRMESSGEVGKVNISETTYQIVKNDFSCEPRGKIAAKGKGEINMYFVEA